MKIKCFSSNNTAFMLLVISNIIQNSQEIHCIKGNL